MKVVTLADGRDLAYDTYGDPDGLPVIFSHGFSDSRLVRNPDDDLTASLGVWMIAADQPGVGGSSPDTDRRMVDWGADMEQLADELGLDTFAVAGHSGGGPHTLAIAVHLPDRVTHGVLASPVGRPFAIGISIEESVSSLREVRTGIRYMPDWDFMSDLQGRLGATVDGLDFKKIYDRKVRRTMGRVALLALHSTEQAVEQAGLSEEHLAGERLGVTYGSTSGSSSELEKFSVPLMTEKSMRGLQPNAYLKIMAHTCAANLANHYKVRGRVVPTCSACTSGSQAIGVGYELIRAGLQDVMLCGGAEEMHYTTAVTFDLLMATSTHYNDTPDRSPRPFDQARDGLVVGEGAGTLVLEGYEHAKARGADILAEVLGYASNCDGVHLTNPSPDGMRRVMELALEHAGLGPRDIEYVCAHGTGTPVGDVAESQATYELFGDGVPVSSLKGYVGHTLGACGAIEAAWTLAMMRGGFLAPNRNLDNPDPECSPLDYVREVREAHPRVTMTNNFAFGGINTSIVLGPAP